MRQFLAVPQRFGKFAADLRKRSLRLRRKQTLLLTVGFQNVQRVAELLHARLGCGKLIGAKGSAFILLHLYRAERLQGVNNGPLVGFVCDQGQSLHLNNHAISCTFCIR